MQKTRTPVRGLVRYYTAQAIRAARMVGTISEASITIEPSPPPTLLPGTALASRQRAPFPSAASPHVHT